MHTSFNKSIKMFLESNVKNQWTGSGPIGVYVRKGHHTLPPFRAIRNTFDIANITTIPSERGKGHFTDWLTEAENLALEYGFDAVFVESVLNPRLQGFLARRGYTKSGPEECPNFFRYCH